MPEVDGAGTVTPDEFQRIRRLFEAVLDRPPADRRAFLDGACDGQPALRKAVEQMLAADAQTHEFIDPARIAATAPSADAATACLACRKPLAAGHHFCPSCGSPVGGDGAEGRFRAGALFANRFRIVSALGRGGMGEVYRAHDLELGQPVALKFLTALRSDERARQRLRNEVRLARQLSHPNVCRVYDIGEANGELYLSMEYVDGEDLAALLKRIGRLPVDKGIEIARKLCAGLAAAHAKGVLHRDLKPANIMVDAGGEVRIMDFGLAAVASELDAHDVRSGTPAYMAPEQLAGKEATKQSDLYALGLVLYELFTGKPAFEAKSLEEVLRLRQAGPTTTPSTLIPELSPRLERAILKCLEPEPQQRPGSALEVSVSLPGGDPLAEALAAGETPSPEMIAAAGPIEALRGRTAFGMLAGIALGLAVWCWLTPATQVVAMLPFTHSPEVLKAKAREVAEGLGYSQPPSSIASGFRYHPGFIDYAKTASVRSSDVNGSRWASVLQRAPYAVSFWYRESPERFHPRNPLRRVSHSDPPLAESGGLSLDLGLDGRLLRLAASPLLTDPGLPSETVVDWSPAFRAAQLDISRFQPAAPVQRTNTGGSHAAWTGAYPGPDAIPVRVEGTSVAGTVTSFEVVFPWRSESPDGTALPPFAWVTAFLLVAVALVASYNWKSGRADRSGAFRVGMFMVAATGTIGVFLTDAGVLLHRLETVSPVLYLAEPVALGLWSATIYLALEPWVRRVWPRALLTWSRVVTGRWRDPLVARDVLVGTLAAVVVSCAHRLLFLWVVRSGGDPVGPTVIGGQFGFVLDHLMGPGPTLGAFSASLVAGLNTSLYFFFSLFLFRALLRKPWLAGLACWVFTLVVLAPIDFRELGVAALAFGMVLYTFLLYLGVRFGFFVLAVWVFVGQFVEHAMLTPHLTTWYGQSTLIAIVVVSAITAWAVRTSLGGRPVFALALDRR